MFSESSYRGYLLNMMCWPPQWFVCIHRMEPDQPRPPSGHEITVAETEEEAREQAMQFVDELLNEKKKTRSAARRARAQIVGR